MFRRKQSAPTGQAAAVAGVEGLFEGLLDQTGALPPEGVGRLWLYMYDPARRQHSKAMLQAVWVAMHLALAQAGNFITSDEVTLILRKDEKPFYEAPAHLLQEVVEKRTRGAYQGVSVPLGGRVRWRAGVMEAQAAEIGRHWTSIDEGRLTLTDERLVYHGRRKTVELALDQISSLQRYGDAVAVGSSKRVENLQLRVGSAQLVAGLIQGAVVNREHLTAINLSLEEAGTAANQGFTISRD